MLLEFVLTFGVIGLSVACMGIGLLFDRGAPRGSCATATTADNGVCPACGRDTTCTEDAL